MDSIVKRLNGTTLSGNWTSWRSSFILSFFCFPISQHNNCLLINAGIFSFTIQLYDKLYATNSRCFTSFERKGYLFTFWGCYKWWMFILLQLIETNFITKFLYKMSVQSKYKEFELSFLNTKYYKHVFQRNQILTTLFSFFIFIYFFHWSKGYSFWNH